MADLLTHILVAFILATLLSWRYQWLTPQFVTVAMVGAVIPDLNRIDLVLPASTIEQLLGIPFDWSAFHRVGGTLTVILIGTVMVPSKYRRRIFALLCLGAGSHHVLDLLLLSPSGHSYAILWPLTQYHPLSPNLYLSTDRWPATVSLIVAVVVSIATRRRMKDSRRNR